MAISLETLQESTPEAILMLLYGVQGIGKTDLGTRFPDCVFLCSEKGFGKKKGIPYWKMKSYSDYLEAISVLFTEEHGFKNVVLDTVTSAEHIVNDQLLEDWGESSLDKVGVNGGGFYKWRIEALSLWVQILEGLEALRTERKMNIILLGHSTDKEERPPDNDPYRKYTLDLLNKEATNYIYRWVDVIGFYNYHIRTIKVGKGKTEKTRAKGEGTRTMYLTERPFAYAKNRCFDDPKEIVMTDYGDKFFELFGLANKKTTRKKT